MMRAKWLGFSLVVVAFATACPEVKDAADKVQATGTQVGGAPKAEIDMAQQRLNKSEAKQQDNMNAASAVKE